MIKSKVVATAVFCLMLAMWLSIPTSSQVTVPYTFTTTVPVAQLNSNLSTIGSGALNRAGGTITGNITVSNGVTLDGVDIGASLGTSGDLDVDSINLRNTGANAIDVAGGINAGSGNVGIVDTSGKIPALTSTYFASLSGASLTSIPTTTGLAVTQNTIAFSAGNYTAGGTQTWGVDAGDVAIASYVKIGTYMFLNLYVTQTDVAGAAHPELRYTVPCTISGNATGPLPYLDAATAGNGVWVANNGATYVSLYKDGTVGVNWTGTAGDNTQIRLFASFNCTA